MTTAKTDEKQDEKKAQEIRKESRVEKTTDETKRGPLVQGGAVLVPGVKPAEDARDEAKKPAERKRPRHTRMAPTEAEVPGRLEPELLDDDRLSDDPAVCPFCGSKISRGVCLGCKYVADIDAAEGRV
jgi:hypothetical protein